MAPRRRARARDGAGRGDGLGRRQSAPRRRPRRPGGGYWASKSSQTRKRSTRRRSTRSTRTRRTGRDASLAAPGPRTEVRRGGGAGFRRVRRRREPGTHREAAAAAPPPSSLAPPGRTRTRPSPRSSRPGRRGRRGRASPRGWGASGGRSPPSRPRPRGGQRSRPMFTRPTQLCAVPPARGPPRRAVAFMDLVAFVPVGAPSPPSTAPRARTRAGTGARARITTRGCFATTRGAPRRTSARAPRATPR